MSYQAGITAGNTLQLRSGTARGGSLLWHQISGATIVASFFMPYIFNGIVRIDHVLSAVAICYLVLLSLHNGKVSIPRDIKAFFVLSFAVLCYSAFRLLLPTDNFLLSLQYLVQYAYLFFGVAIFVLARSSLSRSLSGVMLTLAICGVLVNLVAIYQILAPQSELVVRLLELYGGRETETQEYGEYYSKAAEILLGGGQAISIFTGMQGLAIFNLFFLAIAIGVVKDKERNRTARVVFIAGSVLAIIGGLVSGSKTFVIGLPTLLAILTLFRIGSLFQVAALLGLLLGLGEILRTFSYQLDDIFRHVTELDFGELLAGRYGAHLNR